jgi:hypothetical protein
LKSGKEPHPLYGLIYSAKQKAKWLLCPYVLIHWKRQRYRSRVRRSPSYRPVRLQLASDATSVMVPCAPPAVVPLPVFKPDWETLVRLASTWSKPLDPDVCPTPTSLCRFCGATNKPKPAWFWGPNQETVAVILRPKSPNRSCWFWGPNWETLHHLSFEAQPRNRLSVLRPNQEKPSPPVLRTNWRKPSQQVLRLNR